jgi:serine/threonine protein kinase
MSMITRSLQMLGTYRMAGLLGFNGMFATYKAVEQQSQITGALVAVHKGNIVAPKAWADTQHDIAALQGLAIERVCPVGGCGEESAHYFAVYSWLEGRHLGLMIRDDGLPDHAVSFQVAAQVASALAGLHRKGVVHRVISPASIFITPDGNVQLLHAGWGRLILGARDGLLNPAWGCIAPFVAPEIARNSAGDEASDVYALGANLYFLLCGQPPFWHDDPAKLVELVGAGSPDLSLIPGSLPPAAKEVIAEMLSPDPDDRPVNLPALSDRLLAIGRSLAALQSASAIPSPISGPPSTGATKMEVPVSDVDAAPASPLSGEVAVPALPQPKAAPTAPKVIAPPPTVPDPEAPVVTIHEQEVISPKAARTRLLLLGGSALVVVAAVGILAVYLLMGLFGEKEEEPARPRQQVKTRPRAAAEADPALVRGYDTTSERLRTIAQLAIGFQRNNGGWPVDMEDLVSLGLDSSETTDAWGTVIELRGSFVVSAGANKKWDDDDDIWWDAARNIREGYHPLTKE